MTQQGPEQEERVHGTKPMSAARRLTAAIQAGHYAPGQRLIEAELTASLGISRSALREAFRALAAEGTIELVPNRGALVRRLSLREALELFQIRMELEALAARLAATNIARPKVRSAFSEATASIRDETPRQSTSAYICENAAFHAAIFEAADNRELARLNRRLQLSLIMSQISPLLTQETIRASLTEHRAIAAAVLAGDADSAASAARAHLSRARDFVRSMPPNVFRREPVEA
ncbi:GntR family transcriptional regulator, partial [Solirhodobacter olei]|uniref:GntR family transcriptional regulator n=1 Tax=Solirhodobacter olei TaxID=2493082 RepID=UPI000FDC992F